MTISQVVANLGGRGSAAYYNLQLFPNRMQLDDFMIKTLSNCTIPSSSSP